MSMIAIPYFDKRCRDDGPCIALKAATQKATNMARLKMNNMLADPNGLFCAFGWITHGSDLACKLANVSVMTSFGEKMGCDMSGERALAVSLVVPKSPK